MKLRIGVFVCDCGTNIRGVVDVPAVAEYAKKLKDVVFVDEGKWICSVDYLSKIKEFVKEHKLNRVVVASCTPRTHEPTFKSTVKEAGLNPFLLEFVSIREQCSWVHKSDPKGATAKAKELVKMGVAKARFLEPAEEIRIPVARDCLVIGGGISGMTAALGAADHGFNVKLVEKTPELGGILKQLDNVAPEDIPASEIINTKKYQIEQNKNIKVYTNTMVEEVKGYIGNYTVKINTDGKTEEFKISTIIVATGMQEIEPKGLFGYGQSPNVITQLQLEARLKNKQLNGTRNIVMINCVNSRNEKRGCCNIGCLASIKNARTIKELSPDARVYILYRDINLVKDEFNYQKDIIEKHDIKMIRFSEDTPPEVSGTKVKVHDILLDKDMELAADMVVLTTGFKGDDTVDKLKELLKVSTNQDNFFQEAHIKLRPVDFSNDGIYLAGCARSPKHMRDSIEEAMGAAMRAAIPMQRGYFQSEGIVADIDLDKCSECGLCQKNCPFGAIELVGKSPHVIKAICKGCGTCAANCPKEAITIIHFTDEQILAQIEAALAEKPDKKIVAFCCHWCAMGAVDIAGVSRLEYPTPVRIIRVMCSGRVSAKFITRAFELGAAGVLVAGCEFPTCHYITGNYKCKDKMAKTIKQLAKKNIDTKRLWTVWLSAADGPKFARTMKEMTKELGLE